MNKKDRYLFAWRTGFHGTVQVTLLLSSSHSPQNNFKAGSGRDLLKLEIYFYCSNPLQILIPVHVLDYAAKIYFSVYVLYDSGIINSARILHNIMHELQIQEI